MDTGRRIILKWIAVSVIFELFEMLDAESTPGDRKDYVNEKLWDYYRKQTKYGKYDLLPGSKFHPKTGREGPQGV